MQDGIASRHVLPRTLLLKELSLFVAHTLHIKSASVTVTICTGEVASSKCQLLFTASFYTNCEKVVAFIRPVTHLYFGHM